MKNIDVILFDLDGTLIDSAPDLHVAVNTTMREIGMQEYSLEQITQWVGNGSKLLLQRALTGELDIKIDDQQLKEILPLFYENYAKNLSTASKVYEGIFPALISLKKAGIKMACVTNKPVEFTLPVLASFQLDQFFSVVVGGDSLPQLKPSPEPLLFACEQLNVEREKLCKTVLMVGDSSSDIKAANAAGIQSVAVDYGYSQGVNLLDLGATKMISNIEELLVMLGISDIIPTK